MVFQHAAVWLDHKEARIFYLHGEDPTFEEVTLKSEGHGHGHAHGPAGGKGNHTGDKDWFEKIATAIKDVEELLVMGPAGAKTEFMHFLEAKHRPIASRVLAVEAMDHPTDGQIAAHARTFFKNADRMGGKHVRT